MPGKKTISTVYPITRHEGPEGEEKYSSTHSLSLRWMILVGQRQSPATLSPVKALITHCKYRVCHIYMRRTVLGGLFTKSVYKSIDCNRMRKIYLFLKEIHRQYYRVTMPNPRESYSHIYRHKSYHPARPRHGHRPRPAPPCRVVSCRFPLTNRGEATNSLTQFYS